jgi:hypothetical protein
MIEDWDYDDDWDSQKLAHSVCGEVTRIKKLLMDLHKRIDETLYPEGFLSILEYLHETKEILLDIENTFFSYRRQRTFRAIMPCYPEFIQELIAGDQQEQKKEEDND